MAKTLTQKEWILKFLETHKNGITPKQAEDQYGIMRLASRISDLRRDKYNIVKDTVEVPNRRGQKCRVARYRLVK
jgi:hypothetical protein